MAPDYGGFGGMGTEVGAVLLDEAVEVLFRGGLVVFPTETIYGIGCDPRDLLALERLFRLKHRGFSHRIPFVAADPAQAELLAPLQDLRAKRLVERFWPGPLTLVLPRRESVLLARWDWGSSIALRVPGSTLVRDLARRATLPLPATSANLSGGPSVSDPAVLVPSFLEGIDLLLDAGPLPPSPPSPGSDPQGSAGEPEWPFIPIPDGEAGIDRDRGGD